MLEAPPIEQVQSFVASNIMAGSPQFVAEEEGRIVGWCDVTPGSAAVGTAHVGRLGMGVLIGYRGRKVGRRLIHATIEKARMLGLEKIELGVFSSNEPALALYRSLGFQEEGRKKRGRFVDGIYDDVILMALELKSPNPKPDPTPVHRAPCLAMSSNAPRFFPPHPEGGAPLPFSEAVQLGDVLFLSGQIGNVPGTLALVPGGIVPEARRALDNVRGVLERHGSSLEAVVKCTVFLADIAEWKAFNEVYREYFPRNLPARSALAASGLALGARVELECIAHVPAGR